MGNRDVVCVHGRAELMVTPKKSGVGVRAGGAIQIFPGQRSGPMPS